VTILRGKDGYGFTICSDSPVRVQAVDPGPADQAGLQQLDTLLQLNGQPVEQWKCVDLAHAIRNSANEITVVVWRTGPSAKPNFEGLIHRPSYKPSTSNYDAPSPPIRRRVPDVGTSKTPPAVPPLPAHHRATAARRLLVNGSEAGNSSSVGMGTLAWGAQGGSAEELDGKPRHLHHPHTATLKGTRVKASNGDNYIILAPINPGSQLSSRTGFLRRSNNSKISKAPPASTNAGVANYQQQNANFANYQNCTIVRSHAPHANYGYVKLAPKILIFPIFVQKCDCLLSLEAYSADQKRRVCQCLKDNIDKQ
uniref:PDZ domain-containing protein n=1 Tax=Amphilophus citrinellus TaxID=61819 RepID=A0A3Q0SSG9_AMPCI